MTLTYIKSNVDDKEMVRFRNRLVQYGHELIFYSGLNEILSNGSNTTLVIESLSLFSMDNFTFIVEILKKSATRVILVNDPHVPLSKTAKEILLDPKVMIVDTSISHEAFNSVLRSLIRNSKLVEDMVSKNIQLAKNNDLLQTIIDSLPDLVWVKDLDGVYITCNKRFEQFFSAPRESIIGKTDYDFVNKSMADMFRSNDKLALALGTSNSNEETLTFGDGHVEVVEAIKTPIYDVQRKPYAVLGISRDITARKEIETSIKEINRSLEGKVAERTEELEITSERLSLAAKTANIGTWDWDLATDTFWCDQILYSLFGLEQSEDTDMVGYKELLKKAVIPADRKMVKSKLYKASKGDDTDREIVFRIQRKDGELRYLKILLTVQQNEGKVYRLAGMCTDVTDEMVYKKKLREAKEVAEQTSQAKTRFLANMSHEIRTPINAIVGMNYLLGKTPLDDLQKDYIRKILLSSEQLLGIVTDILDFSKIEAGKIKLEEIPFNLKDTINDIYEIHKDYAAKKDLNFHLSFDESLNKEYLGDPLRLEQILNNLINNAIKFTEVGCVCIKVLKSETHEGKDTIFFKVSDTGIGLTDEQKIQLFQAFHQADTSTTRNYGGTGLGLIICKELVRLMGGEISVHSNHGRGSVFTFELSLETIDLSHIVDTPHQQIPMLKEGIRILVVEDNDLNQELTQQILIDRGAQVYVAENGRQALDLIKDGLKVDLILMDIQMPIMDGKEAAKRIKDLEDMKDIPIIALTADVTKGIKEELLTEGLVDYIPKPVHVGKMIETIKQWENATP